MVIHTSSSCKAQAWLDRDPPPPQQAAQLETLSQGIPYQRKRIDGHYKYKYIIQIWDTYNEIFLSSI